LQRPTIDRIEAVATELLGKPYAELGRSLARDGGIDCLGLISEFYSRAFGIDIFSGGLETGWHETQAPRCGDIAEIRAYQGVYVDHVAVLMPDQTLLHSLRSSGVVRTKQRIYHGRIARWLTRD
jgi:cell wall-associated NlpC family hydrolase